MGRKIFSLVFCLFFIFPCISQVKNYYVKNPRIKENAQAKGYYELSIIAHNTQVNGGDSIDVELYFTGYGFIKQPKVFLSSPSIFNKVFLLHSIGDSVLLKKGATLYDLQWGVKRDSIPTWPILIELSAGFSGDVGDSSFSSGSFIDSDKDPLTTRVITEEQKKNAPITLSLHIDKNARPDNYKLNFYFTYFNGSEWAGSINAVDVRVNNWAQKNEVVIQKTSIIAAIVGIVLGLIPLIINGFKFWIKLLQPAFVAKRNPRKLPVVEPPKIEKKTRR